MIESDGRSQIRKKFDLMTKVFEIDENLTFQPVFLPLHYSRKIPKNKNQEKRVIDLPLKKCKDSPKKYTTF